MMIKCRECGLTVSKNAKRCPKCGIHAPGLTTKDRIMIPLTLTVLFVVIYGCALLFMKV